jgi:hypothetical protein
MTIAESWLPPPFPSPTLGPSAPRWRDSPIPQFYSTTLQLKIDSQEMHARSTLHCQNLWPIAISQLGGFLHFLEKFAQLTLDSIINPDSKIHSLVNLRCQINEACHYAPPTWSVQKLSIKACSKSVSICFTTGLFCFSALPCPR